MSTNYELFIEKPISHKKVLFEIGKGKVLNDALWIKHSMYVWKIPYSWESEKVTSSLKYGLGPLGAGTYGVGSTSTLPISPNSHVNLISTIEVDGDVFILATSLAACMTTPDSFYWDGDDQVLYVYYDGYIRGTAISVAITFGWATETLRFNGILFEGLIKSIPSVDVKQDNLFKSVVTFEGGEITLENTHGVFDTFEDEDIYGQQIKLKFGGDDLAYDDYVEVYTGYIEKFDTTRTTMPISIKDERKNLQRKIPNNYYTLDDYPSINSSNIGKAIGIGYGLINKLPAVCTNEEDVTSLYSFKFVDTTLHDVVSVDQVYVENIAVAHTDGSITAGTFTLADSIYKPGQKVAVTFHGYDIQNPLDVIEDLLLIYAGTPYTSDFFNTTDWDALRSSLPDIGLFIGESEALMLTIGKITSSIFATMVVEGDGKINMKVVDLTKTPVKTIKRIEYLDDIKKVRNSDAYISSAKVGYNRSWNVESFMNKDSSSYSYYINDSEETALVTRFRSYKEQTFNTLLTTASDAEAFSDVAMSLYGGIVPEYTIKTKMQNVDVELEDIIVIDSSRYKNTEELVTTEVISKSVDYTKNTVTFVCRYIN
jgi:hypothetical protein